MFRSLTSIAVGLTAAAALVSPAYATKATPPALANGLSVTGDKAEVQNEHIKETQKLGKNEACRFPVKIQADVRIRRVITNGGDDVYERARGHVKVTNRWTHESLRFRINDRTWIEVDDKDGIAGYGRGQFLAFGDDITVKSHRQGHVSAANRGHERNEGIYYVQGKYKFSITNVSSEDAAGRIYVKRGHVLDVCKALVGHRKGH